MSDTPHAGENDPVRKRHRDLEKIAMTTLHAVRILIETGARAHVAHEGAMMIARGLGADEVGLRSGYASLAITVSSNSNTITRMMTVGPHGVNHRLNHAVRSLAVQVAKGQMTVDETNRTLDRLEKETPRHPIWLVALAVGLACASFGRLFGVDWAAFLPVMIAGTIGQYLRHLLLHRGVNPFIVAAAIAFLAASIGGLGGRLAGSGTINLAMMASILLLVPGVPATNAQTDIMDGYPAMGSARAVTVIMIMIFATTGIWLAEVLLGVRA